MQPYLVVIVKKPTEKQKFDEGAVPEIIGQPQAVMAENDSNASAQAMKFLPEGFKGKEHLVEVYCLPFRRG